MDLMVIHKMFDMGEIPKGKCSFLFPITRGFSVPKKGGSAVPKTFMNQSLSLKLIKGQRPQSIRSMVWSASLSKFQLMMKSVKFSLAI